MLNNIEHLTEICFLLQNTGEFYDKCTNNLSMWENIASEMPTPTFGLTIYACKKATAFLYNVSLHILRKILRKIEIYPAILISLFIGSINIVCYCQKLLLDERNSLGFKFRSSKSSELELESIFPIMWRKKDYIFFKVRIKKEGQIWIGNHYCL